MGFRQGQYVKVFSVENIAGTNKKNAKIAISNKNADGTYTQQFSGFVTLCGKAFTQNIQENGRYKIKSCDVFNRYDKTQNKTFYSFFIFEFEDADGDNQETNDLPNAISKSPDDDGLPF